jgi:hypothetical protein
MEKLDEKERYFVDEFCCDIWEAFSYIPEVYNEILYYQGAIVWEDISDSESEIVRWINTYDKNTKRRYRKNKGLYG